MATSSSTSSYASAYRLALVERADAGELVRRAWQTSATRRSASARSNAVAAAHSGNASRAASIARFASSRSPWATGPSDSPVAGLVASAASPLSASTHSPPMNSRVRVAAVAMA